MAELLKNIYNDTFFNQYCDALGTVLPSFDTNTFLGNVQNEFWENLELKQRMSKLAKATNEVLPNDLKEKLKAILKTIDILSAKGVRNQNLEYIFLADIISEYGHDDLETSIEAIEKITQFTSFEFAGRIFFERYPERMMLQMKKWAIHKDPNVRRYASEGCRPRLPWGMQLKQFVLDPSPIIPILDILKDDSSEYVRKSVANNINDISKDHPEIIIDLIKAWKGKSKNIDWVLKHGARTLLKKGNTEALSLFGTSPLSKFALSGFEIEEKQLKIGDTLNLFFALVNENDAASLFRVEYVIYFLKSNGGYSKKVFKISEMLLKPTTRYVFSKKHKIIELTTRKHYTGTHKIGVLVNGLESDLLDFDIGF